MSDKTEKSDSADQAVEPAINTGSDKKAESLLTRIVRDTTSSVILIAGTAITEILRSLLFPEHVPGFVGIALRILEATLILAALASLLRVLVEFIENARVVVNQLLNTSPGRLASDAFKAMRPSRESIGGAFIAGTIGSLVVATWGALALTAQSRVATWVMGGIVFLIVVGVAIKAWRDGTSDAVIDYGGGVGCAVVSVTLFLLAVVAILLTAVGAIWIFGGPEVVTDFFGRFLTH